LGASLATLVVFGATPKAGCDIVKESRTRVAGSLT